MPDDPNTTDPVAALPAALAYTLAGNQGVKNSALADKYLTERRGRSAKYAADYEDVMSQRQAEVENAKRILDSWEAMLPKFEKVMPVDYKRVLEERKKKAASIK